MSDEKFSYKYSSSQREEIKSIRNKYLENNGNSNLDELRSIERKVNNKANFFGIACGLAGTFLMGIGLTLVLNYENYFIGIPLGVIGIDGMIFAPALTNYVLKTQRKKYSEKVIELTDKLLGNKEINS